MNLYFYSYFDPDSYLDPGVSDCESLVTILRLSSFLAKIAPATQRHLIMVHKLFDPFSVLIPYKYILICLFSIQYELCINYIVVFSIICQNLVPS